MLLPSSPSYSRVEPEHEHKLYRLKDDYYISLERRVRVSVRVIEARATPAGCSGSDYAGLDVFVASGFSVTPWYWWEKAGRFHSVRIRDDSLIKKESTHMREAFLPACMTDGLKAYKNCTHLHVATIHKDGWQSDMPTPGELYDLDLYFIKVFEWADQSEKPNLLASGSHELGTLNCPFVISSEHIKSLESVEFWG